MYGKRDGCGLWVPCRGSWVPSRRSFCTNYWYYYNYRFTSVVASFYGRFGRDVHKHEDSFSVQFQNIASARRGLLCRFQFWNLTPRQTKFSSILQPYTGQNTKSPSWVTFTVQPKWSLGAWVLGYYTRFCFCFCSFLHRSARWYANGTLSPMRGISLRPDHNTGISVTYSLRIVCGFFNVPQLFTTRVMRRDLRLIVLEKTWKSNHLLM